MNSFKHLILVLIILAAGIMAAGCVPNGPCEFTGNMALTVYRLPDASSDFFGTMTSGETHSILAYTSDGWIGFDPGIAQAGNIGLAHHRWFQLNAVVTPSCLSSVPLVTLADVQADVALSSEPTPDPSLSYSGVEIAQGVVVQDNDGNSGDQLDDKQSVQGLTNLELISQLTDQLPPGTETFIHKTAEDIVDQLLADQSIDFESLTRSAIQDKYKDLPVEQTESMLAVILLKASEFLDTSRLELISQLTDQLPPGTETFIHKTAEGIVDQLLADQSIDFESLTRSAIQDEYKNLPVEQTESMLAVILLKASESLDTSRSVEIYLQPDSDKGSDDNGEQSQLANIELQNHLNKQLQIIQMMSSISKTCHDTALDVIRKIG